MTWLSCVVEKMPEHLRLYCAVCQKYEDRLCEMKHFLCAWITGSGNKKTRN